MPKTIDYPRTSYSGAWEVAEVVDDTGGKCAIETAARKLNRKVSGSFKAIIGSAVKFGLLTSKRELLTTTNLFRRIKHAYDKQEEKIYHREAFLHPPLFTQICRKFRNRELPVHMFDVMLIREFGVEEINAQGVAKAFVDGARMAGILDERNVIVDIDQLAAQQTPRRELASSEMPLNMFRAGSVAVASPESAPLASAPPAAPKEPTPHSNGISSAPAFVPSGRNLDAVSSLFGLDTADLEDSTPASTTPAALVGAGPEAIFTTPLPSAATRPSGSGAAGSLAEPAAPPSNTLPIASETPQRPVAHTPAEPSGTTSAASYTIRIIGPGLDSQLSVQELDDLDIVEALLEKIRRRLKS
ncbi:hypothetical protein HNQ93_002443 [Hymenobacter luteus]|uniref:Uncharacterized protein n=2 Tax=Hymenobacter TaxID=89966 RepID=A0A7W9T2M6_9BACT|nr:MULTISPECIES: hypothetical protein [Hymenobacter]MBB4601988.1 hypothetical protein [Hymenobacter latericoloratus]MBB6059583.1 hypothetical protein [Hymenobacter luteus]